MSATIIVLPVVRVERSEGNGAREAMIEIAESLRETDTRAASIWTDWLLMELAARGFMVAPINSTDEV